MGVGVGVLCSACTNAATEIELDPAVCRTASEVEGLKRDSCSSGQKQIDPLTKGNLDMSEISVHEGIPRRASAASTAVDWPQRSREAGSEATEVSTSSDAEVSDGWADWKVAASLCENAHQQLAEQHQQSCGEEINLGSLAPDVPGVLPRFASLEALQPSWMVAARSVSELTPQSRSVGTQAPEDRPPDLAPTARTSNGEQQQPQQALQQDLQEQLQQELQEPAQEPAQELLPSPEKAWPLLPSVGTWLVPHVLQTTSRTAATTAETAATVEVTTAETEAAVEAWHTLPSVGTWLHQPQRCRCKGHHCATSVSFLLHAKDSAEVDQDVEELRKVLLSNLGVKPTNQVLKNDSLLAFDPYAPCADEEHGETGDLSCLQEQWRPR
jgi:hypothetical protein